MADTGLPLNVPYPEPTDLVRDGAAAIQAVAEVLNAPPGAFRYAGTRYFTSSGNFAKADPLGTGDIGLRAIRVRLVAGGGNGGDAVDNNSGGGGGGGGGYAESFVLEGSLSTTETVTVGAAAGDSSFGTHAAAARGSSGSASSAAFNILGGLGGSGTAGDLQIGGDAGQAASRSAPVGGKGGSSMLGGGGQSGGRVATGGINGGTGRNYGGGGGGGARNTTNGNGGSGAPGIVIVDCFV